MEVVGVFCIIGFSRCVVAWTGGLRTDGFEVCFEERTDREWSGPGYEDERKAGIRMTEGLMARPADRQG